MKQIIVFFSLMLVLAACDRSKDLDEKSESSFSGTWELRTTSGAMMPDETFYLPGNGNLLKFSGNTYERYLNGNLYESGTFEIVADNTVEESVCLVMPEQSYKNRIDYSNSPTGQKVFFQFSKNAVTFVSGCYAYDAGHTATYVKK